MRICSHCGLNAPEKAPRCEGCERELSGPEREVPAAPGVCFARLQCTFACRVCGLDAPLDFPDADGAVVCASCGVEQALDPEVFGELFEEAHNLVDLAGDEGPRPGGAQAVAAWQQEDSPTRNDVRARIGAGRPLCECGGVLGARRASPRGVACSCEACGASISYDLPPALGERHGALLGVIAPALRLDRPRAVISEASAVLCPSCGAGLVVQQGSAYATCSFCKTTARLPAGGPGASGQRRPEAWWALFEGPSPERQRRARREISEQRAREQRAVELEQARAVQAEQGRLVSASKRNAALFYAMAVPAAAAFSAPMLRFGERSVPRWYGGPFFVVFSVFFFGLIFGGMLFGVPMSKEAKGQWDPPPLGEQRLALAVAAAVLVASVVVLAVVGPVAPVRR